MMALYFLFALLALAVRGSFLRRDLRCLLGKIGVSCRFLKRRFCG